ncbi:hypothetical protein CXB51_023300 [Gossypium anomalum]|uniref:DUF4219 domain-containing protein n=1 Tax=Gossypium anomalum TaxID=47600 RepID=A0A8J6CUE3_9ROSI|nr:hypothetical protein CXB51_023300 [Gossypium anomalum]
MSSTSFSPPPLLVFNGQNYHIWVVKMKTYLQAFDMWEIVNDAGDTRPDHMLMCLAVCYTLLRHTPVSLPMWTKIAYSSVVSNHCFSTTENQAVTVKADVEPPPLRANPTIAQIRKYSDDHAKKYKVMSSIQSGVSDVIFTRIMICETPKKARSKLRVEFQGLDKTKQ